MAKLNKVYNIDARKIGKVINEKIVDVIITSPPYFDLKDYGYDNQIGFGQGYEEYLSDLTVVFEQVYDIAKDTATLWVVIDAYRRDGEVVPLPFDFARKIKNTGWKLQEIIIWGKDRTVPWAHKGQMRNSFEYVLMFSKSKNYNFFVDEVRDYESLKKWWIKYPERYNPRGKTPDAIWNFDIPTQGSWGKGYIKHFCPLPEGLIAQILKLTTSENDIVLDCFSGSGAVLAKASNMKRNYLGFELNNDYIKMFNKYLKETGEQKRKEYEIEVNNTMKQDDFKDLIINLRALKYARLLYKKIMNDKPGFTISNIFIKNLGLSHKKKNYLNKIEYIILVDKINNKYDVINHISIAPLSKFGIESIIRFTTNVNDICQATTRKYFYSYTIRNTHKFKSKYSTAHFPKLNKREIFLSEIKVDLDEKQYE